ncbi:MAG TPA: GNAT family N-acetyltransferase [Streptosporangiaceae bacterium]|nr:GNAT family N-acetyltransferase [Streptosporangiaceae bacterium]
MLTAQPDQQKPVVVLHADDHQDLMPPRLVARGGALVDLITGRPFDLYRPATVDSAVRSGGISMGSFIVPVLTASRPVHIRHLRMPSGRAQGNQRYRLLLTHDPDTLLAPNEPRPAAELSHLDTPLRADQTLVGSYMLTESPGNWIKDLPHDAVLLLHVDCDYFNNRYDGDSDWRNHPVLHDPPKEIVRRVVGQLCDAIREVGSPFDHAAIALSPGFFPAEYWQSTVESLLETITIRRNQPSEKSIKAVDVRLTPGHGSKGRGDGPGGEFWHIYNGYQRVGSIWINQIHDDDLGSYAGMTIELNKNSRGKGIGRRAYGLATHASKRDEIWLHMRRTNAASRKAAEYAGFTEIHIPGARQLVMRWRHQDR